MNLHTIQRRSGASCIGPTGLKILGAILEGSARCHPPTILELCERFRLARNSVNRYRTNLETAGLIDAEPHMSRTTRATCWFERMDN